MKMWNMAHYENASLSHKPGGNAENHKKTLFANDYLYFGFSLLQEKRMTAPQLLS